MTDIQIGAAVILPGWNFFDGKDRAGKVVARARDIAFVDQSDGMHYCRWHVTRLQAVDPAPASTAEIEAAFDAANAALEEAAAAYKRNRRNRAVVAAYAEALDLHASCAEAQRHHYDRMERAATVARRLALVAPRRALLARQTSLLPLLEAA